MNLRHNSEHDDNGYMSEEVEFDGTPDEARRAFLSTVDPLDDAAAAAGDQPVLQIGMDTPQLTAEMLADCAGKLSPGSQRREFISAAKVAVCSTSRSCASSWLESVRFLVTTHALQT